MNPYPIGVYVVTVRRGGGVHSVVIRWRYMVHALLKKSQLHVNYPVLRHTTSWNKINFFFVDYVSRNMKLSRSKTHNNV